jgi:multiple sugar transport system permease protein
VGKYMEYLSAVYQYYSNSSNNHALAAYSLSKLKPKLGKTILLFFVGTMMISPQALMFPTYIMMAKLPIIHISLINNYWSYIMISTAWAYSVFLFKGFFDSLPRN